MNPVCRTSKAYEKRHDTLKKATVTILKNSDIDEELKTKLMYLLEKGLVSYREVLQQII